jgi:hypothetical protein
MSDLLVSQNAPNATPDGQSQVASAQDQEGTSTQTPGGQSAQDDNIKNLQRMVSAKDAEAKRALSEAQRASALVTQMQQRLAAMEDASAPDDYSRMELRVQRAEETARQYYQAYQQLNESQQTEAQRLQSLTRIATKFGVSINELDAATDYESAVDLALEAQRKKAQRKQEQDDEKRDRNMPDLGGSAPRTVNSKAEAEWEELVRTRDTTGQARWLRLNGGKR